MSLPSMAAKAKLSKSVLRPWLGPSLGSVPYTQAPSGSALLSSLTQYLYACQAVPRRFSICAPAHCISVWAVRNFVTFLSST